MINRLWRVFGTGFCFFVFGLAGLILGTLVFPLLRLARLSDSRRIALARRVLRAYFRGFVKLMELLGILRYEVSGRQALEQRGLLIVANHPSLIDTIFLMSFVQDADCIVKSALWRNPFTGGPVRAANYLNNENGPGLVEDCIASLRGGSNLIIFPEGTRTPAGGALRFKRGAANVAVRGRHKVTPVIIRSSPTNLGKGDKWWRVPMRPMEFHFEVKPAIDVLPFLADEQSEVMAARRLTQHLQDYFIKEKQDHAAA